MKKLGLMSLMFSAFMAFGCAHPHSVQGNEQRSEIPEGVRVAIGSSEVSEGEKVEVFRPVCKKVSRPRGGTSNSCRYEKVGEARVLKVLDHDSAIVEPDQGLAMDTNMKVEKKAQ